MTDFTAPVECPMPPVEDKPVRKRVAKVAKVEEQVDAVREWKDVVPLVREMKEAGATVPEIAEKLQLSYTLVNQVMLQSYKMTVDTIGLFERQERARVSG